MIIVVEETLRKLWRFVNYETEIAEFEQWVYAASDLENKLPCRGCGQHWYLFVDTDTDDYYLYRMKLEEVEAIEKDIWPRDVDAFNQHLDSIWFQKKK